MDTFIVNCVNGIEANETRCEQLLEQSVGIVTALNPYIGYTASAALAKKALETGTPIRELVLREGILTEEQMSQIMDPYRLTKPGFVKLKK